MRQHQLDRKLAASIDYACFFVNANRRVALDRDAVRRIVCLRSCVTASARSCDRFPFLARQRENRVATKRGQAAPQLRLKNHHQCDCEEN